MERFEALRNVLFDLDGTLLDSQEGILSCIEKMLCDMGGPYLERTALRRFIGPPFQPMLQSACGYSEEEALRARTIFCDYYAREGLFAAQVIAGIPELLQFLRDRGLRLGVASSKPQAYCRTMLEHFGLSGYFCVIVGSKADGKSPEDKATMIRYALDALGGDAAVHGRTLMIGDRHYDVEGAHAMGLECIGLNPCGFAEEGELAQAGALAVFDSAYALTEYFRAALPQA